MNCRNNGLPLGLRRRVANAQDFMGGCARTVEPAHRMLPAADVDLVLGGLGHRDELPGVVGAADQFVDHACSGGAGARDQRRANSICVGRGGPEGSNGVLVEIRRDDDLRVDVAQAVQELTDPPRLRQQVTGIEPHRPQFVPGELDGGPDSRLDVEGVHQQCGAGTQRVQLRPERVAFGVMQEREGVRGRADGPEAEAPAGFQVRRCLEAGNDGGPGGRRQRPPPGPGVNPFQCRAGRLPR